MGERRPWGKWRLFAAYWAVMGPATYIGWSLLAGFQGRAVWIDPRDEPGLAAWVAGVILSLMMLQAVFLFPVRAPGEGAAEPVVARMLRCLLAGVGVGVMVATAFTSAAALVSEAWHPPPESFVDQWFNHVEWAFWVGAGLLSVAVSVCLMAASWSGASARLSVVIAAMGAGGLAMGIPVAALSVCSTLLDIQVFSPIGAWAVCGMFLLNWAVATPLLARFVRRRGADDALGRIAAGLFTGTVIEAAAVIPVDVMVRRKTNCYCGEGTLWTLTICWGVGMVALGPAIWLIPMSRRRKRWYSGHCPVCGYDMTACPGAERCPECGSGWKAAAGEEVKR